LLSLTTHTTLSLFNIFVATKRSSKRKRGEGKTKEDIGQSDDEGQQEPLAKKPSLDYLSMMAVKQDALDEELATQPTTEPTDSLQKLAALSERSTALDQDTTATTTSTTTTSNTTSASTPHYVQLTDNIQQRQEQAELREYDASLEELPIPRDAKVVLHLLRSMGVTEYDPHVVTQLMSFIHSKRRGRRTLIVFSL
jgi:hypothetical protein